MANVDDPVGSPPAGNTPVVEPAISSPDPARYEALEAYYARTNPILEQYKDDFNAIVEDEGYRDFQRKSRESYYDMQKRVAAEREAEIPESEKRLLSALDERLGKFKPVLDDYENRAKSQEQAAKDAKTKFEKEQNEYVERLMAEKKLSERELVNLGRHALVLHEQTGPEGQRRFVSLEEAYKDLYGAVEARYAKPVAKSLRSTAGATGVPGASRTVDDRGNLSVPGGITRHVLGVLNDKKKAG